MGGFWGIATIVGPILFVAVLAFAWLRNKSAPESNRRQAEQSAVDLREELPAERQERERSDAS